MFEAAKVLVPQGAIKFSPTCPKYDTLVFDDGSERKLSKVELESLVQMDLMKEEMVLMVRVKPSNGGKITYQLPTEYKNKVHDDRNYVAVMSCLELKSIRDDEDYGDGVGLDYSNFTNNNKLTTTNENNPWIHGLNGVKRSSKSVSPFQGVSPFKK